MVLNEPTLMEVGVVIEIDDDAKKKNKGKALFLAPLVSAGDNAGGISVYSIPISFNKTLRVLLPSCPGTPCVCAKTILKRDIPLTVSMVKEYIKNRIKVHPISFKVDCEKL
jgi:hypothetical protein